MSPLFRPNTFSKEFKMSKSINLQPKKSGQRRRFTAEQKRVLLDEATKPGNSVTEVGRRYGVSPRILFQWKRAMDDATNKSLKSNERVEPESEVKKLKARASNQEKSPRWPRWAPGSLTKSRTH